MRAISVIFLLLLAGCTNKTPELKDVLPIEVQRSWILKQTAPLTGLGAKRAIEARYEGNGAIKVRLYEMAVEASAFELIQTWRQSEGLAVQSGHYFAVAIPEGPDRNTTGSFLQEFRTKLRQ